MSLARLVLLIENEPSASLVPQDTPVSLKIQVILGLAIPWGDVRKSMLCPLVNETS